MDYRRVAAALVATEGIAAIGAGVAFVGVALLGHPEDRPTAVVLGVLLAALGLGIAAVARGVFRDSGWARTPAYLTQFFGLVVAWYQRTTLVAVTVCLGVVCVAAVVSLAQSSASRPSRS